MREYSQTLLISILLLLPFLLEKIHGAYLVENTILEMDSLSSVNSGITNAVKDFLGLVFPLFGWLLMWLLFSWKLSFLLF
jgi:hypothetical protein